jgi:hypothetical protein
MYKTCGFNVIFDEWDKGRMTRYRLLAAILGRGMQAVFEDQPLVARVRRRCH